MNRGLDEAVADLLKNVDNILEDNAHTERRMVLSIKRLVVIESRLEEIITRLSVLENKLGDKSYTIWQVRKKVSQEQKYIHCT